MESIGSVCAGRLCWIWGLYALAMLWLSGAMSAAGFPDGAIWAAAATIGVLVLIKTEAW